jgi:hypothetical protein
MRLRHSGGPQLPGGCSLNTAPHRASPGSNLLLWECSCVANRAANSGGYLGALASGELDAARCVAWQGTGRKGVGVHEALVSP